MRKTTHGQDYGIQLGPGKLSDLDFADDIALLSSTRDTLQDITTDLQNNGMKVGLYTDQCRADQSNDCW